MSFVPSADDADRTQFRGLSCGIQVTPLSVDVKIWPLFTTATSRVPPAEQATDVQSLALSRPVQVTPLSVEV